MSTAIIIAVVIIIVGVFGLVAALARAATISDEKYERVVQRMALDLEREQDEERRGTWQE